MPEAVRERSKERPSAATGPSPRAVTRLRAVARAAALFAVTVASLVLVGWLLDVRPFMQVLPGQVAMVPNTAIAFILAGLALWWRAGTDTRSSLYASGAAAAACILLGLLALAEYFSGLSLGIDELLFRDRAGLTGVFPGRMAVLAAVSFVAIGSALLLSNLRRAQWATEALAVVPGVLALISLAGYAYGARSLDWIGKYKGMAIHTAAAFLVLSLGVLLSRGDRGFARLMVSDTVGGIVARRIIPVALGVPLVLGWLHLVGGRAALYGVELRTALYAVSNAVVLLAIFWGIAAALMRSDQERKRAEEALKGSERRYRVLAAAAPVGIYRSTPGGRFVSVNAAFARLLGYDSIDEVLRLDIRKDVYLDNADRERVIAEVERLGGIAALELRLKRKDGSPVWVRLDFRAIRGDEDRIEGFEGFVHDITERKRAEQALAESEDHYRDLVEHGHGLICTHDLEGRILSINDWASRALGRTQEELLTMRVQDVLAPEGRHEFEDYIARIRRDGVASGFMLVETTAREKLIWEYHNTLRTEGVAAPIVRGMARDVTQSRRTETALREKEHRLSESQRIAHIGSWLFDRTGRMTWSDETYRIFGFSPDTFTPNAESFLALIHPEDRAAIRKWIAACLAGRERGDLEFRRVLPDGTVRFVIGRGELKRNAEGRPAYMAGTVQDITERKRAEESLQKLQHAVDQADNVVFVTDPEGVITYVNPAFERVYGYTREESLGKTPRILKSGRHNRAFYERFWGRLLAGESVSEELANKRRSGELVTVEASVSPVLDSRGRRVGFIAVQHDLTERRRTEEALRKSEQRFSLAFHASPIPTIISEIDTGRMLDVNQQFLRILGYSREEVIGKTSLELGIFVDRGDRDQALARVREKGAIHDEVTRLQTRSGEFREVVGSVVPIELSGVKCALWTFLDITERRQVEMQMQERTTFLNALVEHSPLGILVLDPDHRVKIANSAFVSLFGYSPEDLQGRNPDDLIAPDDDALRAEAAALTRDGLAGHPVHVVTARRRKDGALVEVELYGVPLLENGRLIGVYAIYQDLTERRRLEEQFRRAQKMEAVGQLAGGVAHDFNNLLTAILGYADLLAVKLDPGSLELEDLNEIRKAGERAASLTRQLLAFSRQQVLERKVLDVNDLITDVEKMLRRLIGEDVTLVTVLNPALRRVRADAGQLDQVIMNLAVNARDAMPRGGRLTIETANVELDEAYASQHVTVRPGSYVMIAVSDTGGGMDGETLAHMFEPFFTTKGLGKGTGLGLATVYGIVKQSGGYIWAYSEVEKGTTFKVYLPPVEEGVETELVPAAEPAALRGSETVLLVEDEQSVRALSCSILKSFGYTVLEAASGKEGLEVARNYPPPIHLLLTDVVMPEMGGSDLASRLLALRPGVRVLYMSGYTDDAVFRHGLLEEGRVFLQKPFTPEVLARKIREALGR